jgi:polysaccharide export outer membrane protein
MNKMKLISLGSLLLLLLLSSCTPQWMFQEKELMDAQELPKALSELPEQSLKAGDKITLSVWGHDELGVGSTYSVYSSTEASGKYLIIDKLGEISLPLLGKQKVGGLTVREANLMLEGRYAQFLKDPIIQLRVLSHRVTVLGEVNKAGNYELDRAGLGLLEVVGEAGGFSQYADLRKVSIFRQDEQGKKQELKVDLTDKMSLYRPELVLQDKDLIYVPERRAKQFDRVSSRLVPVVGLIGSGILLVSIFKGN